MAPQPVIGVEGPAEGEVDVVVVAGPVHSEERYRRGLPPRPRPWSVSAGTPRTIASVVPPEAADWLALSSDPLPVAEAAAWAVVPACGGVVTFTGTVRDHADGRDGVTGLVYEAYESFALARMVAVACEVRGRHPGVGRLAILHRVGPLQVTEAAVVVVASAPHRDEAFAAARLAIDATKASVPIWKRETWGAGTEAWGTGAAGLVSPSAVPSAAP
jgi:molybdopterin synthase catalytic subunit